MVSLFSGIFAPAASAGSTISVEAATPANIVGKYQINDQRTLALTQDRQYYIQDGRLVEAHLIQHWRPYCFSDRKSFDDVSGAIEIFFNSTSGGANRARLATVPSSSTRASTTIECISEAYFKNFLDLQIALGRIVELSR